MTTFCIAFYELYLLTLSTRTAAATYPGTNCSEIFTAGSPLPARPQLKVLLQLAPAEKIDKR